MKKGLTVIYEGPLSEELDKALEEALKPFGYRRWASGFDLIGNERDLSFEKTEQEGETP